MPANWNATSGSFQLRVIITSVPSITVMLMHPKTQNCIIYVRPDHTFICCSCYSCLLWGFRICVLYCIVFIECSSDPYKADTHTILSLSYTRIM